MTEQQHESLVGHALRYAAMGWRVVPLHSVMEGGGCSCSKGKKCPSAGKHPRHRAWQKTATPDEEVIAGWWQRWPGANIGVVFGRDSGLVDFECDTPEEERALVALFGGDMPVTLCFRSSRGKHWLFLWRSDLPDAAVVKVSGVGIRIGGGAKGAMSVFPPSIHPSGEQYRWLLSPEDGALAEIPDAVAMNLNGQESSTSGCVTRKAVDIERLAHEGAQEPERHEAAKAIIGSMVSGCETQQDVSDAWEAVRRWNERNRNAAGKLEPLPEGELRSIFDWTIQQERRKKPGGLWRIVTVGGEPPEFRLYTPYFDGWIRLTAARLLRWETIRQEALSQKHVWLPGSERKRWEGSRDAEALGAVLMRKGEREPAMEEIIFSKAVAERVRDTLVGETSIGTKRIAEGESIELGLLPLRSEGAGGGVYFVFTWLLEKLNLRTSEKVTRPKLSEVLKEMGAVNRPVGIENAKRNVKFVPFEGLRGGGAKPLNVL